MINRLLAVFLATGLFVAPASARDLPQGGFFVSGDVFLAVTAGAIVPTFAHVQIEGTRIDWSLFTSIGDIGGDNCTQFGICERFVRTLSHEVSWADDDTLDLRKTDFQMGEGQVLDDADRDREFIYPALADLMENARLIDGPDGLVLRGGSRLPRRLDLVPATTAQLAAGHALLSDLEQPFIRVGDCGLRGYLSIARAADPTEAQKRILAATDYLLHLAKLARADREGERPTGMTARMIGELAARPGFSLRDADPTTLTDEQILTLVTSALAAMAEDPRLAALIDDMMETHADGLVATLRHRSRFDAIRKSTSDPAIAVCDTLLSQD